MRKLDKPIRISQKTKEALRLYGEKGETFDEIIQKLIEAYRGE